MLTKFDAWVRRGPFTPLDLGIYRILYSFCTLLLLGDVTWVTQLPDSLYAPPVGPFQILSGFPAIGIVVVMEVARALSLVLLGLGLWTKTMSIIVAVLLTINFGLTYSVGKIGHTILLVMTPLILSFAGWGRRISIDSLRRPSETFGGSQKQWPLRLLALVIALSFLTAAGAKLATGWLEFNTQAAQGYFLRDHLIGGESAILTDLALGIDSIFLWELVDWMTVIIEFAFLATLLWWRAFRVTLALATLFHLGVLLVFGIGFPNVIAYGAFVSWSIAEGRFKILKTRAKAALLATFGVLIAVGGLSIWWVIIERDEIPYLLRVWPIYVGAVAGASYLVYIAVNSLRRYGETANP